MLASPTERIQSHSGDLAGLCEGTRVTDYVTLGVVARTCPVDLVHMILKETGRESAGIGNSRPTSFSTM